jgi:signal transduction histidine kinase
MQEKEENSGAAVVLVISRNAQFLGQVQEEFGRRRRQLRIATVNSIEGARRVLEMRAPAVILFDDECLENDVAESSGRTPTLWAAVTSLAESAPVVVIGGAERQAELTALLAAGTADYVTRSEGSAGMAVGVVELRLRQGLLRSNARQSASRGREERGESVSEPVEAKDFGEVLRHELNNPLTGILGNAELLLVEVHRHRIELPPNGETRLQTIATLAVRMRETIRKLSEEWETNAEKKEQELAERPA